MEEVTSCCPAEELFTVDVPAKFDGAGASVCRDESGKSVRERSQVSLDAVWCDWPVLAQKVSLPAVEGNNAISPEHRQPPCSGEGLRLPDRDSRQSWGTIRRLHYEDYAGGICIYRRVYGQT